MQKFVLFSRQMPSFKSCCGNKGSTDCKLMKKEYGQEHEQGLLNLTQVFLSNQRYQKCNSPKLKILWLFKNIGPQKIKWKNKLQISKFVKKSSVPDIPVIWLEICPERQILKCSIEIENLSWCCDICPDDYRILWSVPVMVRWASVRTVPPRLMFPLLCLWPRLLSTKPGQTMLGTNIIFLRVTKCNINKL